MVFEVLHLTSRRQPDGDKSRVDFLCLMEMSRDLKVCRAHKVQVIPSYLLTASTISRDLVHRLTLFFVLEFSF